ncbi:MAG: hypothetical protein RLY93_07180 [Sumerlaeia bacterium]
MRKIFELALAVTGALALCGSLSANTCPFDIYLPVLPASHSTIVVPTSEPEFAIYQNTNPTHVVFALWGNGVAIVSSRALGSAALDGALVMTEAVDLSTTYGLVQFDTDKYSEFFASLDAAEIFQAELSDSIYKMPSFPTTFIKFCGDGKYFGMTSYHQYAEFRGFELRTTGIFPAGMADVVPALTEEEITFRAKWSLVVDFVDSIFLQEIDTAFVGDMGPVHWDMNVTNQ